MLGEVDDVGLEGILILADGQEVVLASEEVNRVIHLMLKGILNLEDQHIPKFLLAAQKVVLSRRVCVLHSVDC